VAALLRLLEALRRRRRAARRRRGGDRGARLGPARVRALWEQARRPAWGVGMLWGPRPRLCPPTGGRCLPFAPRAQVLERGAAAVPYSVAFWEHYASHLQAAGADAAAVRRCAAAAPFAVFVLPPLDRWVATAAAQLGLAAAGPRPQNAACAAPAAAPAPRPRSVLERAVAYCATDHRSTPLWDRYLSLERAAGTPAAVAALYARALQCPLDGLDRFEAE
jgi:hypothetical protein